MKLLYSACFIAVLGLSAAYAQDPNQSSQPQQKQQQQPQSDPQKTSFTGCLTKGSTTGSYILTEQTSGQKVSFNGPEQLDRFVNQTVKLTGTVSGDGADKQFNPETIAQVSPSCGKAQQ